MKLSPRILVATLGQDPHTQGIVRFNRIAQSAGFDICFPPPDVSAEQIIQLVKEENPGYLAFSYRKSPERGYKLFEELLHEMMNTGLLSSGKAPNRKIAFAGLSETCELIRKKLPFKDLSIRFFYEKERSELFSDIFNFLDVYGGRREALLNEFKELPPPPSIKILDEIADFAISGDYLTEEPLFIPGERERRSFIARLAASPLGILLRTHFGIPAMSIEPTVQGIRAIAAAQAIDEISLGSSDGSQRAFNRRKLWDKVNFDGGVPYKTTEDLALLVHASRTGNFPGVKPYAHVSNMANFVEECLKAGALVGTHQAVPLYFFNELDGRSETRLLPSIKEHIATMRMLSKHGIPVEINDANHWSSRYASDAIYVTSHLLSFAVIQKLGIRDYVLQLQFNKPRETGDLADLAKMQAIDDLIAEMDPLGEVRIYKNTRAGIDSFEPAEKRGKWQLARSTLLQMMMNPSILHIVNYTEAYQIATPEVVIESSKIVRRTIRLFREKKNDIIPFLRDERVLRRKEYIKKEARFLIKTIAMLNKQYHGQSMADIHQFVAEPDIIYQAIDRGIMAAPGIVNHRYQSPIFTGVNSLGGIDCVDSMTGQFISEEERF